MNPTLLLVGLAAGAWYLYQKKPETAVGTASGPTSTFPKGVPEADAKRAGDAVQRAVKLCQGTAGAAQEIENLFKMYRDELAKAPEKSKVLTDTFVSLLDGASTAICTPGGTPSGMPPDRAAAFDLVILRGLEIANVRLAECTREGKGKDVETARVLMASAQNVFFRDAGFAKASNDQAALGAAMATLEAALASARALCGV